mgnify:CR=1 FL=1
MSGTRHGFQFVEAQYKLSFGDAAVQPPTGIHLTTHTPHDLDGSGTVDLAEYVQWALAIAIKESKGRVLDLFRDWDDDKSGFLDLKEAAAALKAWEAEGKRLFADKAARTTELASLRMKAARKLQDALRAARARSTRARQHRVSRSRLPIAPCASARADSGRGGSRCTLRAAHSLGAPLVLCLIGLGVGPAAVCGGAGPAGRERGGTGLRGQRGSQTTAARR